MGEFVQFNDRTEISSIPNATQLLLPEFQIEFLQQKTRSGQQFAEMRTRFAKCREVAGGEMGIRKIKESTNTRTAHKRMTKGERSSEAGPEPPGRHPPACVFVPTGGRTLGGRTAKILALTGSYTGSGVLRLSRNTG